MNESNETDLGAERSFNDGVSHSGLVFNLFFEGELPESINEESDDELELQEAPAFTEAKESARIR